MNTVYFDSPVGDDLRRERIFQGQFFVYSPSAASAALRDHAREMLREAFAPHEPEYAQFEMSVEDFVAIMGPLKPRFIHDAKTKELLRTLLGEIGCDMEKTYFDVPRIRVMTSDEYLTSGVGYTLHAHRDVWYSQPMCQLNWWMPVYDFESESSMAFHLRYWDHAIKNGSANFNYYEWNSGGRKDAAKHVKADTRKQPGPEEPVEADPQLRVVCPAGGVLIFSAAHLHSTVPNTSGRSRFSVDFRTAHIDDLRAQTGAHNLDNASTGTNLRDLMQGADLSALGDDVVALYETEEDPEKRGELVFRPS
jgi:hypothetical protein